MQATADIIQSKSDKREYKHFTLPNKMQCLVISDMEADKSAASLDVHVGCSLDPKPYFGTAHFLEHMLFMGSTKYPSENEYSEFISDNGGYSNAYTSLTNTNYQFEVSNESLEGGLDRFAQFFICPLLKEDAADREMQAVDSEYNMSLQHDAWRQFMLQQSLAHEDSLLNRFNCGNLETLKQEGIREVLLNFHK
jgi:insulysin